jgi:hypothetical protein
MYKKKQTKSLKRLLTMAVLVLITAASHQVHAQNGVGINPTGAAADPSAALDVAATNKGVLVPRMTAAEKVAIASPANGLLIFQTDGISGFWYYNATTNAWMQAVGPQGAAGANGQGGVTTAGAGINVTGAGTVASPYVVSTTSPCGLAIGQTYQGGIIFYLDPSGCHGLVCAPTDIIPFGVYWSNVLYPQYFTGCGLFEGKYNTDVITTGQNTQIDNAAAYLCFLSSLGGFNDWYLPSIEELNKMFQNIGQGNALGLGNIGSFLGYYWSSSDFDGGKAWLQGFGTSPGTDIIQGTSLKTNTYNVRAIRAF